MENVPNFVGSTAFAAMLSEPLVACLGWVVLDFFAIGKVQYSRHSNSRTKDSAIRARFITIGWVWPASASAWQHHGYHSLHPRASLHPSLEGRRRVVHCRSPCPLEYFSPGAFHRRARRRPETEADAFHDPAADRRCHPAPGQPL